MCFWFLPVKSQSTGHCPGLCRTPWLSPLGEAELPIADLQIQQCQFACSLSHQGLLCLEGTSAEQVVSFQLFNEAMLRFFEWIHWGGNRVKAVSH